MNLAEQLLKALKGYGVKEIFGIPGDFALPLFKVIEETGILPLYTLLREQETTASRNPAVIPAQAGIQSYLCFPKKA